MLINGKKVKLIMKPLLQHIIVMKSVHGKKGMCQALEIYGYDTSDRRNLIINHYGTF